MPPPPAASEHAHSLENKVQTRIENQPSDKKGAEIHPIAFPSAMLESNTEPSTQGTGILTWELYYEKPVSTILKPLFFASIGFSIPISQMFAGSVVWRGIIYSILMALAKLLCGIWLVRFSSNIAPASDADAQNEGRRLLKPKSLYPASIIGCAMVARGEISILISAVAESRGVFSSAEADGSSNLFLIVTWAIVICTIAGPIAVGLLTRRARRLQKIERDALRGRENPLGV